MKVVLRTACGAEQVLELDPLDPSPDWIVVEPPAPHRARRFRRLPVTDRYPLLVYREGAPGETPLQGKRVAVYGVAPEANPRARTAVDLQALAPEHT